MAVMERPERPEDREKNNKTAAMKIPSLKSLTIDELLDLRNNLKKDGGDTWTVDTELSNRFF